MAEERYLEMLAELRPGARQLVCGLHVRRHGELRRVPADAGRDQTVAPVLAVSLNSPYVAGAERRALVAGRRLLELPRAGSRRAPPRRRWLRGDRSRRRPPLHAQLVGWHAVPDAGSDRRPADERRPVGCARGADPGLLRGTAASADGSRDGYLVRQAAAAHGSGPVDELLELVRRRRSSSAPGTLVESLRGPVEALRQLETGRRDGLVAAAAELVALS